MKYLSLCLATNGVAEWVFPVLDNIFKQDADIREWEIVVTDNGNNKAFGDKMQMYVSEHSNLIYKKTDAFMFENQIEALKIASGKYLKFINHRSMLQANAIKWMIDVIKSNIAEKPIIYWSNGALHYDRQMTYIDFDGFVRGLKEFASWTTGVGVWKSDFEKIPESWKYNKISPHSDVLFRERHKAKYIIDDSLWCQDIDSSHAAKGKYDLYRAFGVEEITITLSLLNDGDISADTFKYVVKCYEKCVARFYLEFNILHQPCSYTLDGFNDAMGIFLNKRKVIIRAYIEGLKRVLGTLKLIKL